MPSAGGISVAGQIWRRRPRINTKRPPECRTLRTHWVSPRGATR